MLHFLATVLALFVIANAQRDIKWRPTSEEKAACSVTRDEYFRLNPTFEAQLEFYNEVVKQHYVYKKLKLFS